VQHGTKCQVCSIWLYNGVLLIAKWKDEGKDASVHNAVISMSACMIQNCEKVWNLNDQTGFNICYVHAPECGHHYSLENIQALKY
jgi:hypothetical protein